jgi:hypothetical protein
MGYVKLAGTRNRHTSWVSEVVLEVDDDGNPTKVVRAGVPVSLSSSDQEKLEARGFTFESSSKSEFESYQEEAALEVGADVAGAAPVFGDSEAPDQAADDSGTGNDK